MIASIKNRYGRVVRFKIPGYDLATTPPLHLRFTKIGGRDGRLHAVVYGDRGKAYMPKRGVVYWARLVSVVDGVPHYRKIIRATYKHIVHNTTTGEKYVGTVAEYEWLLMRREKQRLARERENEERLKEFLEEQEVELSRFMRRLE